MNDNSSHDQAERKSQVMTQFNVAAENYDAGPGCFAYFGKRLVEAAEIQLGQKILDVASGRGAVLFPCAEQIGSAGEVIGIDFAEEMVRGMNAEATKKGISARAQIMDAENLEFPDEAFDRVLCGFGIMFFPDKRRALAEFRRVLKPRGLLAVSTWRPGGQNHEIHAARAELGMELATDPGSVTEPSALEDLLKTAGFTNIDVSLEGHAFRYANVEEYWQQARGTGLRRYLDGLNPTDAQRIHDALKRRVCPGGDGEFYSNATALFGIARR